MQQIGLYNTTLPYIAGSQLNGTASATFSAVETPALARLRVRTYVAASDTCGGEVWLTHQPHLLECTPRVVTNYIPLSRAQYRHLTRPSSSCEGRLRQTNSEVVTYSSFEVLLLGSGRFILIIRLHMKTSMFDVPITRYCS